MLSEPQVTNVTETFTVYVFRSLRYEEVRQAHIEKRVCNSSNAAAAAAATPWVHTWFLHYIMWTASSLSPSHCTMLLTSVWDITSGPKLCHGKLLVSYPFKTVFVDFYF